MPRNDAGLTGGVSAGRGPRGLPIGTLAIIGFGLLFGYLSCLYGREIGQETLVAFGAWSAAAILIGFLVTWFFKYVLILAFLAIAALWFTESPTFASAASEARAIRTDLCQRITFEFEGVPYKDWIC